MQLSAGDIHDGNLNSGIPKVDKETIIADAKKLDHLLTVGFLSAITIILAKILKSPPTFEFFGVPIKMEYSWLIFLLFTIAHGYFALCLKSSVDSFCRNPNVNECMDTFKYLSNKGGIFFRGLMPRIKYMDRRDQSTWIEIGGVLLLLSAIIPFEIQRIWHFGFYIIVAFEIAILNWSIGTCWVRAVSRLKDPEIKETPCLLSIFNLNWTILRPIDLLKIIGTMMGIIIFIYLHFIWHLKS